jgi:hypothetical protein
MKYVFLIGAICLFCVLPAIAIGWIAAHQRVHEDALAAVRGVGIE